ncbi:hypothetical protein MKY53_05525 [Macrococcus sp. FSL R5-0951]
MNTHEIFSNIHNRFTSTKEIETKHQELLERYKALPSEIDYYRKRGDVLKASELNKEQAKVEKEFLALDKQTGTQPVVTQAELEQFNKAYTSEIEDIKAEYQKHAESLTEQLEAITEVYKHMAELRYEAKERVAKKSFLEARKDINNTTDYNPNMPLLDIQIVNGTNPHDYAQQLKNNLLNQLQKAGK